MIWNWYYIIVVHVHVQMYIYNVILFFFTFEIVFFFVSLSLLVTILYYNNPLQLLNLHTRIYILWDLSREMCRLLISVYIYST